MSKQLSDDDIKAIAQGILNFSGKPTWKDVVEIARARTGHTYSRVALSAKHDIKAAYDQRTDDDAAKGRKKSERPKSKALQMTEARLENLQRKLAHAEKVNAELTEQFVVWSYNARLRGMTKADLDRPLPVVDRQSNRKEA